MTASNFDRYKRFGDCKPNEVYIGCNVFAVFDGPSIWFRLGDGPGPIRIDHGGVSILSGALAEWREKNQ